MKPEENQMRTLLSCLQDLQKNGFGTSFKVVEEGLQSLSTMHIAKPSEVKVVHFYRFEGESDPDDNSILYAIETAAGEKGSLINGYGISSDPLIDKFMQQVEGIHK